MQSIENQNVEESASEIGLRTAKVASYILASKVLSLIMLAFSFIAVARILGPGIYGIYVLATATVGIFGAVGNFGIATAINKFSAEYKAKNNNVELSHLLSNGLFMLAAISIILASLLALFSVPIAAYVMHSASFAYVLQAIALSIIFSMLFGALYGALIGMGKGSHASLMVILQSLVQSTVSVVLAYLGYGALAPILGLVLGMFTGFITGIVLVYGTNKVKIVLPSIKKMKPIMKFSLPIAVSNIFNVIVGNLGPIILSMFATTLILGNFGVASKVNYLFDIIIGTIGISLLPTFASSLANKRTKSRTGEFYSYSLYVAFLFVAPLVFIVAFLSKPFSYVAFSSVYTFAPLYILVMSIGVLLGMAGNYAVPLLLSANKVKTVVKYNIIIALVGIALMPILIPTLKGTGLVLLLFIINPVLYDIFFIYEVRKSFNVKIDIKKIGRVLAANFIGIAFVYPLVILFGGNYIPLIIGAVVVMVLIYPPVLALLKGVEKHDIETIRKVVGEIPIVGSVVSLLLDYSLHFVG